MQILTPEELKKLQKLEYVEAHLKAKYNKARREQTTDMFQLYGRWNKAKINLRHYMNKMGVKI